MGKNLPEKRRKPRWISAQQAWQPAPRLS